MPSQSPSVEKILNSENNLWDRSQNWGITDPLLKKMAMRGKRKADSHSRAKLHRPVKRTGRCLPVKVSTVKCWIRTSRKRVCQILCDYPILRLTDWIDTIFNYGGHFLLGGRSLDHIDSFKNELFTFWSNYKVIDPELPFFERGGADEDSWSCTIPLAIHGDEGRGRAKQPIMIIGVQPILPLLGEKTNMQGYPERFLNV